MQFYRESDQSLITQAITLPGLAEAYGQSELPDSLVGEALPVRVKYRGAKARTEVDLFTLDPLHHSQLLDLAALDSLDAGSGTIFAWDDLTRVGTNWPRSATLHWRPVTSPDEPIVADVGTSDFGLTAPSGPGLAPTRRGSIKAAYVYDHGACSFEQPLDSLFQTRGPAGWNGFKGQVPAVAVQERWTRIASFLENQPGNPFGVEGGFRINVGWWALFDGPQLFVRAAAEYYVQLDDAGHVVVPNPAIQYIDTTGLPKVVVDQFFNLELALDDVAIETQQGIEAFQYVDLFGIQDQNGVSLGNLLGDTGCDPAETDTAANCAKLISLAGSLTNDGWTALFAGADQAGGVGANVTITDPQSWSCRATGTQVDPQDPFHPKPVGRCFYFLPVRRLNLDPDAFEAVFFDGKEPTDPAYAFWVLLNNPLLQAGQRMCNYNPPSYPYAFRSWTAYAHEGPVELK